MKKGDSLFFVTLPTSTPSHSHLRRESIPAISPLVNREHNGKKHAPFPPAASHRCPPICCFLDRLILASDPFANAVVFLPLTFASQLCLVSHLQPPSKGDTATVASPESILQALPHPDSQVHAAHCRPGRSASGYPTASACSVKRCCRGFMNRGAQGLSLPAIIKSARCCTRVGLLKWSR